MSTPALTLTLLASMAAVAAGPHGPAHVPPRTPPLGAARHHLGIRKVTGIPTLPAEGGRPTPTRRAVIYYPARAAGENVPVAPGRFPVVVFGHARRYSAPPAPGCPRTAPTANADDYLHYQALLGHLARRGFLVIAPDVHGLTTSGDPVPSMAEAALYLIAQGGKRGSPFHDRVWDNGIVAIGHSTSGAGVVWLATSTAWRGLRVSAVAMLAPAAQAGDVDQFAKLRVPAMIFDATRDTGRFGARSAPASYYAAARSRVYSVTVKGGNHFNFSDSLCVEPDDPRATIDRTDQQRVAKAFLTVFAQSLLRTNVNQRDYLAGRPIEDLRPALYSFKGR